MVRIVDKVAFLAWAVCSTHCLISPLTELSRSRVLALVLDERVGLALVVTAVIVSIWGMSASHLPGYGQKQILGVFGGGCVLAILGQIVLNLNWVLGATFVLVGAIVACSAHAVNAVLFNGDTTRQPATVRTNLAKPSRYLN